MMLETTRNVLLWCLVMNYGLLLLWFIFFITMHDFMYRMHSRWFNLSVGHFDALHYGLMGLYKLAIILFLLVPFIALHIVG
jgi:hypothetical protein